MRDWGSFSASSRVCPHLITPELLPIPRSPVCIIFPLRKCVMNASILGSVSLWFPKAKLDWAKGWCPWCPFLLFLSSSHCLLRPEGQTFHHLHHTFFTLNLNTKYFLYLRIELYEPSLSHLKQFRKLPFYVQS